jgi:hypothetical protein
VLAACDAMQEDGLKDLFQQQGAEIKVFEQYKESLQS